jgi:hypothetical protein
MFTEHDLVPDNSTEYEHDYLLHTLCYNSVRVCIKECCEVTVRLGGLHPIKLPARDNPYCVAFGSFDKPVRDLRFKFENEACKNGLLVAVQLADEGVPPDIDIAPDVKTNSCGFSNIDGETICFKRTDSDGNVDPDSPTEHGVLFVMLSVDSETISKKLFDDDDKLVSNYKTVSCC